MPFEKMGDKVVPKIDVLLERDGYLRMHEKEIQRR